MHLKMFIFEKQIFSMCLNNIRRVSLKWSARIKKMFTFCFLKSLSSTQKMISVYLINVCHVFL